MKRVINFAILFLAWATLLPIEFGRAQVNEEELLKNVSRGATMRALKKTALETLGPGAAVGSAFAKAFAFPTNVRDDAVFGIDIYHGTTSICNCTIDWDLVASNKVSFVYVKASQGQTGRDTKFLEHWRALEKHRILTRGAYHFLSPYSRPEDQADTYLSMIGGMLQARDLPPAMDLEWTDPGNPENDGWKDFEPDKIIDYALTWLKKVEAATNRTPVIYTSHAWWMGRIQSEKKMELLKNYPIWIADYSNSALATENVKIPQGWNTLLWQFTAWGNLEAANIRLPPRKDDESMDVSIFKGTLAAFYQAFGVSIEAPGASSSNNQSGGPAKDAAKDATLGTPTGGSNTPSTGNSATTGSTPSGPSGGSAATDVPSAQPANQPGKGAKRPAPRDPNDFDVFGNRGGPDIRME